MTCTYQKKLKFSLCFLIWDFTPGSRKLYSHWRNSIFKFGTSYVKQLQRALNWQKANERRLFSESAPVVPATAVLFINNEGQQVSRTGLEKSTVEGAQIVLLSLCVSVNGRSVEEGRRTIHLLSRTQSTIPARSRRRTEVLPTFPVVAHHRQTLGWFALSNTALSLRSDIFVESQSLAGELQLWTDQVSYDLPATDNGFETSLSTNWAQTAVRAVTYPEATFLLVRSALPICKGPGSGLPVTDSRSFEIPKKRTMMEWKSKVGSRRNSTKEYTSMAR